MNQLKKKQIPIGTINTSKKHTTRRNRLLRLFLMFCFFMIVGLGAITYAIFNQLEPVDDVASKKVKQISIRQGSSVKEIGDILEKEGVIKNATLFTYYAKWKGIGTQLKAGDHQLNTSEAMDTILQRMTKGIVYAENIRFTIPEGWNVEEIATSLAEKGLIEKDIFLREINTGDFPEHSFVANIPKKQERKHRLEGYLFPETYEIRKGATEHEIVSKMLEQFQKEVKPEWMDTLQKKKMSVDEAVTLASIVEREVAVDKERPIVAGVYFNRLRNNWLLQADATVQFVLGKQRDLITFDDLKINSPYNTYLHKGLPPGPIANPGRASIEAVVTPTTHDYFFYVTKKDGTQEHYFTKTFEEHKATNLKSKGN